MTTTARSAVTAWTAAMRRRAEAEIALSRARLAAEGDPLDDGAVQAAAQALHDARRAVEAAEQALWDASAGA